MNSIPLSISEEMHLLAQQLQHHFSSAQLEELARKLINRVIRRNMNDQASMAITRERINRTTVIPPVHMYICTGIQVVKFGRGARIYESSLGARCFLGL